MCRSAFQATTIYSQWLTGLAAISTWVQVFFNFAFLEIESLNSCLLGHMFVVAFHRRQDQTCQVAAANKTHVAVCVTCVAVMIGTPPMISVL